MLNPTPIKEEDIGLMWNRSWYHADKKSEFIIRQKETEQTWSVWWRNFHYKNTLEWQPVYFDEWIPCDPYSDRGYRIYEIFSLEEAQKIKEILEERNPKNCGFYKKEWVDVDKFTSV